MLTAYRKLQEWLAERGVKPLFKDLPGSILEFLVAETGHWDSGLRNSYFFHVTGFESYLLYNEQHKSSLKNLVEFYLIFEHNIHLFLCG